MGGKVGKEGFPGREEADEISKKLGGLTVAVLAADVEVVNQLLASRFRRADSQLFFQLLHVEPSDDSSNDESDWRQFARVHLLKVTAETKIRSKTLSLRQFYRFYNLLMSQPEPAVDLTASMIATSQEQYLKSLDDASECSICMERRAESILPCTHTFCSTCLDMWMQRTGHRSCPMCREEVQQPGDGAATDECWVVTETPSDADVASLVYSMADKMEGRTHRAGWEDA